LFFIALIVILWLPTIIILLPGSVYNDASFQIRSVFRGTWAGFNQFPMLSNLVIGYLFALGRLISPSVGVFTICLFAIIVNLLAFSQLLRTMKTLGASFAFRLGTALFIGIVPDFALTANWAVKDAIYIPLFVLFTVALIRVYLRRTTVKFRDAFYLMAMGGLMCLFRHDAIYVVLPTILVMTGYVIVTQSRTWKQKKPQFSQLVRTSSGWMVVGLCVFLALYSALYVLGATHATTVKGKVSEESMSLPLQMVARVAVNHPEAVSEDDQRVIDQVYLYRTDLSLEERYRPTNADWVKGYNIFITSGQYDEFMALWRKYLVSHPRTMLDGALNQTYLYWYPFSPRNNHSGYGLNTNINFLNLLEKEPDFAQYYGDQQHVFSDQTRQTFDRYVTWFQRGPITSLFSAGSYFWLLAVLVTLLLRRKAFPPLTILLPFAMLGVICLAAPISGFIRYAFPLIASSFLLISFTNSTLTHAGPTVPISAKEHT